MPLSLGLPAARRSGRPPGPRCWRCRSPTGTASAGASSTTCAALPLAFAVLRPLRAHPDGRARRLPLGRGAAPRAWWRCCLSTCRPSASSGSGCRGLLFTTPCAGGRRRRRARARAGEATASRRSVGVVSRAWRCSSVVGGAAARAARGDRARRRRGRRGAPCSRAQNLSYKPFAQNRREFLRCSPTSSMTDRIGGRSIAVGMASRPRGWCWAWRRATLASRARWRASVCWGSG